ncbi:MAG: hypothetical protein A2V66_02685 [Ignavibacteria bacterium RBG_13_36_8]|nr:MAG: hypothetical protein A2V66_02685 [Ignavibacteria bacterium RBG_13_36_8]
MKWRKRIPYIVLILAAAGFAFYKFVIEKSANENKSGVAVEGYTAFDFQKQGELSFTDADGKFVSRIDIEVADDEAKRNQGMMYRSKMEESQGMFFVFPAEGYQSFWMKNTVLPLDIIFVNSKMEIVRIHKNTTPFSEQSYASFTPAQYVVEVIGGYCDKMGIEAGNKIVWRRN